MKEQRTGTGEQRKSLKDCSDDEIVAYFRQALEEIRKTDSGFGIIRTEVSGGRVKFLTIERPFL